MRILSIQNKILRGRICVTGACKAIRMRRSQEQTQQEHAKQEPGKQEHTKQHLT